jgi:hypothetical protein
LCSCVSQPSIKIPIILSENQVLDFIGRGAAAGIMLDSVMGGAGVAIGIAIDKGIAKDIAKNLDQHKPPFNIVAMVDAHVKNAIKKDAQKKSHVSFKNTKITVERYGFKTAQGGDDLVSAWLEISFVMQGHRKSIRYPEDFDTIDSIKFASAKENPDAAYVALDNATDQVVKKLLSSSF